MRDFFKDTKDAYERRYGEEICKEFPRYGEFWSAYIGQRRGNPLRHYEINSSRVGIANFNEKYEKMTLAHYGIFVDLCGVIIGIRRLSENAYKTVDDVLSFWEDVRNAYSKMGDSIYKYEVFLNHVKDVLCIGKIVDPITDKLIKDLAIIKGKRNYIVHFAAMPFMHDTYGKIKKMPKEIYGKNGKPLPYSVILKQDTDVWVPVEMQIKADFKEIANTYNEGHKTILSLFGTYKKFEVINPGTVDMNSNQEAGTNIKGYRYFSSSFSGTSGFSTIVTKY